MTQKDRSGRVSFEGEIAGTVIRDRYMGKNVNKLFKKGEISPIKEILNV